MLNSSQFMYTFVQIEHSTKTEKEKTEAVMVTAIGKIQIKMLLKQNDQIQQKAKKTKFYFRLDAIH